MGGVRDLLEHDRARDGDVAQRIEELDRQLEFLVEELPHVRHARGAAAEENALRLAALLLGAIKADRARDFRVQPGHRVAHHLGDPRHFRIGRFGIGAAQTNEPILLLAHFGRRAKAR